MTANSEPEDYDDLAKMFSLAMMDHIKYWLPIIERAVRRLPEDSQDTVGFGITVKFRNEGGLCTGRIVPNEPRISIGSRSTSGFVLSLDPDPDGEIMEFEFGGTPEEVKAYVDEQYEEGEEGEGEYEYEEEDPPPRPAPRPQPRRPAKAPRKAQRAKKKRKGDAPRRRRSYKILTMGKDGSIPDHPDFPPAPHNAGRHSAAEVQEQLSQVLAQASGGGGHRRPGIADAMESTRIRDNQARVARGLRPR